MRGLDRLSARVNLVFAVHVAHWTQHLPTCRVFLRRAFDAAQNAGDLTYAAYSCADLNTNLLASGDPLGEVEHEVENALEFVKKVRFGLISDLITAQHRLVRTLRGLTPNFGSFNDTDFDESRFEQYLDNDPSLAVAASRYWIRKLQACVYAGNGESAVAAASKAASLLWTVPTQVELSEYHFYAALGRAARCDMAAAEERPQHLEALSLHLKQIAVWADNCPATFANRAALVRAELARLKERELEAERLYEEAIRSARANGFIQNEALANELAGRFYAARGFEQIAHLYLRNARYGYLRWGADGKVRQLDELYAHLREEESTPGPTSTIGAPIEHLDLATVIKVSQAVSSEIVLEMLIDVLMRTALEQAGAARGLLIVPRGAESRIEAEATTVGETIVVQLRDQPVTAAVLPESVLHYVLRTRESVILDDAAGQPPFAADPYLRQREARSILCLPLITQAKLIGVLYLENNLASHVFTPARISVLKLLASQAAISLENARLYNDLREREARIRRLVESNIIGIIIGDSRGRIIEANNAFLDMLGYSREDLISGRIRWTKLTPTDWAPADQNALAQMSATGSCKPFEKEYFRKDGSRVPVLVGGAFFEERDEGVVFVIDTTERKRAEAEARESERRYREVQMELEHANRIATMGQLTASIAHEVRQPIAATVTNAQAGLRFLGAQAVDLNEVRQILNDIVQDGNRAGEVVGHIRDLVKKAPPRRDRWEINGAIREVIQLTHGEAVENSVSVRTELTDGLPLVQGDRVELQQVVLNLIVNAIQAMSGLGEGARELLISTSKVESGGVLVTVRDSGPRLAPATLERVFESFYTTKPSGMGLGLSICRSIVEAHGGRLWASANDLRGATFQFTIPAVEGM
jgi:PAS domain S-box-containing protein